MRNSPYRGLNYTNVDCDYKEAASDWLNNYRADKLGIDISKIIAGLICTIGRTYDHSVMSKCSKTEWSDTIEYPTDTVRHEVNVRYDTTKPSVFVSVNTPNEFVIIAVDMNNVLHKLICSDSIGSSQYAIGNINIKEVQVFIYNSEATTPVIN